MALLRTLSLEHALVCSFAQLRAHTHVHLLIAALNVVRPLRYLGLIHVKVVFSVALADGSHQYLIRLVPGLFHLPVSSNKLISVRLADELEVALVLVLEAHEVRLANW